MNGDSVSPAELSGGDDDSGTPVRGRRLGIDVGSVRVGVAMSDPDGILATPVETVPRAADDAERTDLRRIDQLADEYSIVEVIVGLPRTLRGEIGPAARDATSFARDLGNELGSVPVRLSDERLTTVDATRTLRARGVRGKKQRSVVDQAAAVAILQGWLDERRQR